MPIFRNTCPSAKLAVTVVLDGLSVSEWSSLSVNGWASLPLTGDELARVTWTYDPTGQLLSEHRSGANDYQATYVYDPSGNRLVENLVDGRVTSTYDAANRLLKSVALSGITTYSYDAAGNRRTVLAPSGDVTTSTWNGQNQLIRVELPTDDVVTYVWAPVNKLSEERIVSRDDGGEVQQLLWDNNNVLRETDDLGSVQAEYTYQPQPFGDLVSEHRATESSFYRFDALGSTTSLTDASGNITDEYRYAAFGIELSSSGTSNTPYRWVGQLGYRQDDATGLSNLRARNYDPHTGRFVSQDPLGLDAGDSNFYRYVGNQPVSRRDPSGLYEYYLGNGGVRIGVYCPTNRNWIGREVDGEWLWMPFDSLQEVLSTNGTHDWDQLFRDQGSPSPSNCPGFVPPPPPPVPPARPAQCAPQPKYDLIEDGLPFKLPRNKSGCQLSPYYNCEVLHFPKDSRVASVADMAETISIAFSIYVSLIPGLGTLIELISAWQEKDVITGQDLSRLEQALGLLFAAAPAIANSPIADIIVELLEHLRNSLRGARECGGSLIQSLDDLVASIKGHGKNPSSNGSGSTPKFNTLKYRIKSRINESAKLVKEAEAAGISVQKELDDLVAKLATGNLNPGIGSKTIGCGISEARGRNKGRVYWRIAPGCSGTIEILAKSSKANQQAVITELFRIYCK